MRYAAAVLAVVAASTGTGYAGGAGEGSGAGSGSAVSPQDRAEALFVQARASYDRGEFRAAIDLFERAYALVHDPVYLFNIAQSYRKVLDCEEASAFYHRYLDEAPDAPNRKQVEQWQLELAPCVEQRRQAREAAQRAQDEAARLQRVEEERRRRQPYPVAVDRGGPLRAAGIATGAVGLAGLAVAVAYSIRGSHLRSDVAQACGGAMGCDWDQWKDEDAAGKHANTYALVGYVGGGVAVAAAAVLYALGHHRIEHVMVTPAPGGGTVGAWLTF